MTDNGPDKLTKWIINLQPQRTFLYFGLLLPMYSIWLRQVGLFVITQNGRNDKIFKVLSTFFVVADFILFPIGLGFQIAFREIPDWMNFTIPLALLSVWFLCNGIACKNMIDYENRHNEYFFGFLTIKEYVFRFFHLFYFPFSIYWLQKDVNRYIDRKSDD